MVYFDEVNILDGSVRIIKKYTKSLVVASKENGLEVNGDKSKYMVMSRDRNAGQSSFERVDSSSTWEQPSKIKILFRKKLRAD